MKKISRLSIIFIFIVVFFNLTSFFESLAESNIQFLLNGCPFNTDMVAIIEKNRTLVPIRGMSELIGADVEWIQSERKVVVKDEEKEIELQIGNNVAKVDGEKVELDVSPTIINGSTYLPLRFVSEKLGQEVVWKKGNSDVQSTIDIKLKPIQSTGTIRIFNASQLCDFRGVPFEMVGEYKDDMYVMFKPETPIKKVIGLYADDSMYIGNDVDLVCLAEYEKTLINLGIIDEEQAKNEISRWKDYDNKKITLKLRNFSSPTDVSLPGTLTCEGEITN